MSRRGVGNAKVSGGAGGAVMHEDPIPILSTTPTAITTNDNDDDDDEGAAAVALLSSPMPHRTNQVVPVTPSMVVNDMEANVSTRTAGVPDGHSNITSNNNTLLNVNPTDATTTATTTTTPSSSLSLSIEERYQAERHAAKLRHWREGPYAAGFVELSWRDELQRLHRVPPGLDANHDTNTFGSAAAGAGASTMTARTALGHKIQKCCEECTREDIEPSCGCNYLSGWVCGALGASRVGNMAVLKESMEWVELEVDEEEDGVPNTTTNEAMMVVDDDGDDDEEEDGMGSTPHGRRRRTKKKVFRSKIDIVVGPYWPMLVCITYPLIFGISGWTAYSAIPNSHPLFVVIWSVLTFGLIYALFNTGCRDPGILRRRRTPPPAGENSTSSSTASGGATARRRRRESGGGGGGAEWRWSDQAQSYRPRNAVYDPDCAAIIEDFDHTCPWAGTAIGKKNMAPFQAFVGLVFVCLVMDILLLTRVIG